MVLSFPSRRSIPAVLYVGPYAVEWFERTEGGEPRYARIDVAESTPEVLARAVAEARRAAGAEQRAFILAVSHPLAFHKLLSLPPLSKKELAQVFQRRAAALAGEDAKHVYYAAREMERETGEGAEKAPRAWLVAGVRGGARDLRLLLRDQGLRARRVVSADLAALEWGRQHAPLEGQAAIVVVVGESVVSIALTSGACLIYQASIEGDLSARPALATGLIHEFKTCAAFWKKESRGQTVGQVLVVGLPKARVELLALTLSSILPGASVNAVGDEARDPSGRRSLLEAPLASGPLNPSLTSWLPPRRRQAGLALALVATVALATTLIYFDSTRRRVAVVKDEVGALRRGTADLEELRAQAGEAEARVEEVERYVRRRIDIDRQGFPVEELLASVLQAFAGRADFDELSVQPLANESARVTILGRCDPAAHTLVARLRAVLDELQRGTPLTELSLQLPEDFNGEGAQGAAFTIEACWKRHG